MAMGNGASPTISSCQYYYRLSLPLARNTFMVMYAECELFEIAHGERIG